MNISTLPHTLTDTIFDEMCKECNVEPAVMRTIIKVYGANPRNGSSCLQVFQKHWFANYGGCFEENFEAACEINKKAAYLSTSWGMGGVMGHDYKDAGYVDVNTMILLFQDSQVEQFKGLLTLILSRKRLMKALREKDWARVAYNYKGIGYVESEEANALESYYKQTT